ncbi:hypothetical protein BV341_05732 [Pseudomonas syringae pv. actinidiae]|nr:hypothetical protein BV341_05732 [Pseudomonas syringae pv. actinidiae]
MVQLEKVWLDVMIGNIIGEGVWGIDRVVCSNDEVTIFN